MTIVDKNGNVLSPIVMKVSDLGGELHNVDVGSQTRRCLNPNGRSK